MIRLGVPSHPGDSIDPNKRIVRIGKNVVTLLFQRQIQEYERDGIVFPIRVLTVDEALSFRSALESVAIKCGGVPRRFDSLHLFFRWAHELATRHVLLNAVEDILGPEILIDGSLVFYKPPRDSSYVSWHQDSVYSGWHLTPSTSAWIALTESHSANGCMRVIPGSHKKGLLEHANVRDSSNLLRRGEQIDMAVDESAVRDVILQPGEMSLHHSTIVHGSNANASSEPRIGFIVRFVTNRTSNPGRPIMRARGQADCAHLTLAQPPTTTDADAAFSAWRAFTHA